MGRRTFRSKQGKARIHCRRRTEARTHLETTSCLKNGLDGVHAITHGLCHKTPEGLIFKKRYMYKKTNGENYKKRVAPSAQSLPDTLENDGLETFG